MIVPEYFRQVNDFVGDHRQNKTFRKRLPGFSIKKMILSCRSVEIFTKPT
jgi:hypothetical protein